MFDDDFFRQSPRTPRLARCLRQLCRQIDHRWPQRSSNVDGWLGDARHAQRESDHNPDAHGVVCALDVSSAGIDVERLVQAAIHHPSVHYVISRRQIWQARNHWRPVSYTGPDPHVSHVHISCYHDLRSRSSTTSWAL